MSPTDLHIVAGFLLRERDRFAAYLDDCAIEPTEADIIIDDMVSESNGLQATCMEKFSGFIGE